MSDLFDKYGHSIKVLIDPDCPQDLFDKSGRPHIVVENADGIDLSTSEFLAALLKGGILLHIPTNAGWSVSNVGSGGVTQFPFKLHVHTGVTANSRGLAHCSPWGLQAFGIVGRFIYRMDWSKKMYFIFHYCRFDVDTEVVARVQFKTVATEGALGAQGLGIRVDNFTLIGESYGTALGTISLGTLMDVSNYQVTVIHYPSSKIEWYLNGTLVGTQTTLANIPSGTNELSSLVHSIINGATGGVDADSYLLHPKIWQEM